MSKDIIPVEGAVGPAIEKLESLTITAVNNLETALMKAQESEDVNELIKSSEAVLDRVGVIRKKADTTSKSDAMADLARDTVLGAFKILGEMSNNEVSEPKDVSPAAFPVRKVKNPKKKNEKISKLLKHIQETGDEE